MKICAIGDPHGNLQKIKKIPLKGSDLILLTGDLGKVDLAKKMEFKNLKRKLQDLPEIEEDINYMKKSSMEIYNSTMKLLKYLSGFAPVYTITGNVWMSDYGKKRGDEKKFGIKIPYLHRDIKKLKEVYLVRNTLRRINGLRIGFLEYFIDTCWVRKFNPPNYEKRMKEAKKENDKAKRILKRFSSLNILICHQPPYGFLDKVNFPGIPENWKGKHAGSKTILNYIKKEQPRYVFCGHIHEGKGKKKIGKTEVYNLGVAGYKIVDFD